MAQVSVSRTAAGLYTNPNAYNEVPEGALLEASNVTIEREGVISKRRGLARFGQVLSTWAEKILEYKDRLILHNGTQMLYDQSGTGIWAAWTGTFGIPEANAPSRIHSQELKENFYFTSDLGIYKNDDLDTIPVRAGMPPGLDTDATLTGTGGGFFPPGNQVAYRWVWGRVDRNFNSIVGAPSTAEIITNPLSSSTWTRVTTTATVTHTAHGYANGDLVEISNSSDTTAITNGTKTISNVTANTYDFTCLNAGAASGTLSDGKKFNVALQATIPDGVEPEDFYEIYRTNAAPLAGDRCLKIKRVIIQAADLTKKIVTFTDTTDSEFLEEDLYTNAEREGIEQANTRPPWAKDIAEFNSTLFYANTQREEAMEFRLLTTSGLGTDGAISLTGDGFVAMTYSCEATESLPDGNGFVPGRQWKNFEGDASVPLQSQKVEKSIKSLIRVINRDPTNSRFYAFYVSGLEDAPGTIRIERRTLNTGRFAATAIGATFASKWSPALPTTIDSLVSDNNRGKNILAWSKFDQPEAAPEANQEPVGAEQYEILRILRIKTSLIILKEDGAWRASGAPNTRPQIDQLDPTVRIVAPEAACVLDDAVWCLATIGLVRITETGTEIVSDPIDDTLQRYVFSRVNYRYTVQLAAYESAQKLLLVTPGDSDTGNDPENVWAYAYQGGPNATGAWTKLYDRKVRALYVPLRADKLYIADDYDKRILEERRTTAGIIDNDANDFQDEEYEDEGTVESTNVGIDDYGRSVSIVTVNFSNGDIVSKEPKEGWCFVQAGSSAKVIGVTSLGSFRWQLKLSKFDAEYEPGACTLVRGIESRVRWTPEDGETVALLKRWQEVHVALQSDTTGEMHFTMGFRSDIWDNTEGTNEYFIAPIRRIFQQGQPYEFLRVCPLPYTVQRGRSLGVIFIHKYNLEPFHVLNVAYKFTPTGSRVTISAGGRIITSAQ